MSTTGWGRGGWGLGAWGTGTFDEVTLSGFAVTATLGSVDVDAQAVITLTTLAQVDTFLGVVDPDAEANISLTGFSIQVRQGSVLIWDPIPAGPSGNWVVVPTGPSGGWVSIPEGVSGSWVPSISPV